MIDPKIAVTVETVDGKYRVVLHTTQRYYVVDAYVNGIKQFNYRTTVWYKANKKLASTVKEMTGRDPNRTND